MRGTPSASVPPELYSTYRMLDCAFPESVRPEDYIPLLAVLDAGMSFRGIAEVIALFTSRDWGVVYNDVLSMKSWKAPDPQDVARIKQRLVPCGYEDWLKEE